MKRAMVLLSLTALIMLSAAPALAQQVDKPVLPDGYANWSYAKTYYACKDLKSTAWAKIDKEKNTLEVLIAVESKGNIVAYDYLGGDSSKPKFGSSFLMSDGKWRKFDGMNMIQYNNFLDRRDQVLTADGITDECIFKMDDWINDVVLGELLKILKSKK